MSVVLPDGPNNRVVDVMTKSARRSFRKLLRSSVNSNPANTEGLSAFRRVGSVEVDRQTTIRSDTIRLEYREPDGSISHEYATRLLSYPRTGPEQRRREGLLSASGNQPLVTASRALSGKAYWEACRNSFVDLPGFTFSQSHRAWANKKIARAVYAGLPKHTFTSITLLICAVPSFRMEPFDDSIRVNELIESTLTRFARTLQSAGVSAAYLNGAVEVAEQRLFHDEDRVREYVSAYRERHWPKDWVEATVEYVYVLHMHVGLCAHDGTDWLSKEQLRPFFKSEFRLPYESWLARRRRPKAYKNAERVAGYARKNPRTYSNALVLEDVAVRLKVRPNDMWLEGFWHFGGLHVPLNRPVRYLEYLRRREIEKLEITGAAVGFRDKPQVWSGDLVTHSEKRTQRSLWCRITGTTKPADWAEHPLARWFRRSSAIREAVTDLCSAVSAIAERVRAALPERLR